MNWKTRFERGKNIKAIQIIQLIWMAFSVFALGVAIPGIPHYLTLLGMPCNGTDCLDAQLTNETAQSWLAIGVKLEDFASSHVLFLLIIDILMIGTAAFLIWRKADNRASVVAAFVGIALATSTLSQSNAIADPVLWFPAHLILFVQMAGLLPLFCLLPDGHFQPAWIRWVALIYVIANVIYLFPDYSNWIKPGTVGYILWLVFTSLSGIVVIANLFLRYRRSKNSAQQEQMLWVLASISLAAMYILSGRLLRLFYSSIGPKDVFNVGPASEFIGMFMAIGSFTCLLVALVNYEPIDIKIFVNRSLVYLALTAFVIAFYGIMVGYLSTAFHSENILFSLIATGMIAILFQPLRERLQRGVNRMMYGRRDEPYQVLTLLGQQLASAIDPATAISLTVETVARSLKLSYVAITFKREGQYLPVAAFGRKQTDLTCFPLIYAGETIGELEAAYRSPNEPFSEADQRLLSDLAQQISVTVHAAQLAADLQSTRLRIVEANEETRRQIGNDLHDGVGHQLAGLARKTEQAVLLIGRDPAKAPDTLNEMKHHLNAIISQVRTLAHQLHPPELEVLGLVGALRERCQTFSGFTVRLEVAEEIPHLPAAIETAAYYIALEALTNIEKHAVAQSCLMRFSLTRRNPGLNESVLEIEINDDGLGLPLDIHEGLGLLSMQGRAIEVGGTCQVTSNPNGGTRVLVCLPVRSLDSGV